jgi:glucose 1-dehydrogenase
VTSGVAVVTGGGAGIGAATCRRLARDGHAVVMVDLDEVAATAVRDQILDGGGTAELVVADVADPDAWADIQATAARLGGCGVLVANAFAATTAPAHEMSVDVWNRQLQVNLTGTFLAVRALVNQLVERRGAVVVVSSVHAVISMPGFSAYATSKGGLTALARQLAAEYGPAVRVNAVLPGPIDTASWDGANEQTRAVNADETVLGRFGAPEEVANAIAFLTSAEASYVTGTSLLVDGGWTVRKRS